MDYHGLWNRTLSSVCRGKLIVIIAFMVIFWKSCEFPCSQDTYQVYCICLFFKYALGPHSGIIHTSGSILCHFRYFPAHAFQMDFPLWKFQMPLQRWHLIQKTATAFPRNPLILAAATSGPSAAGTPLNLGCVPWTNDQMWIGMLASREHTQQWAYISPFLRIFAYQAVCIAG